MSARHALGALPDSGRVQLLDEMRPSLAVHFHAEHPTLRVEQANHEKHEDDAHA